MSATHQVTLTGSGRQFVVSQDETVLDGARRQGHLLPYSCRSGTCGTCKARLVEGRVEDGHGQADTLDEQEVEQGLVLLCQARARSDLVVDARELETPAVPVKTLPCRVGRRVLLTHDVMQLTLELPPNRHFEYVPGQYVDLLLRDGRRRSFSMATPAGRLHQIELHVRRVPDGFFTNHVFSGMGEGDLLRLQGPLGTFCLRREDDAPILFMAGGTGIAPIKAIIEDALAGGIEQSIHLFWGVRAKRDLYLTEQLETWRSHPKLRCTIVLSEPEADSRWQGETGWVHEALLRHYPDLDGFQVYASGPPPMIEVARPAFLESGLSAERFFSDSFEFSHDSAR